MSAIDFSIQYTTMNFTPTPESSFIVSSEPTADSKSLTLSELVDHHPRSFELPQEKMSGVTTETISVSTSTDSDHSSSQESKSSDLVEKVIDKIDESDDVGISSDVLATSETTLNRSSPEIVAENLILIKNNSTPIKSIPVTSTVTAAASIAVDITSPSPSAGILIKESSSTEELSSINAQLEAVTRAIRSLSSSPPPAALARSYSFNLENDRELGTFLKQETLERSRYEAFVLVKESYIAEDEDHKSMCAKLQLCQEVCN
jgi:hypothetical protein